MYEPWIDTLDVSEVPAEELEEDPDRPFDLSGKKYPTKMERTGIFSITTLQDHSRCLRQIFADYLQDVSATGSYTLIIVLHFLAIAIPQPSTIVPRFAATAVTISNLSAISWATYTPATNQNQRKSRFGPLSKIVE